MSSYRINYNGQQVSRAFGSYVGDDEWSGAGMSVEKRRPHEHRS